jgi:hypothetical protein
MLQWCRVPSVRGESEADIFLAFSAADGARFDLHVENKIGAPLATYQAEDYAL